MAFTHPGGISCGGGGGGGGPPGLHAFIMSGVSQTGGGLGGSCMQAFMSPFSKHSLTPGKSQHGVSLMAFKHSGGGSSGGPGGGGGGGPSPGCLHAASISAVMQAFGGFGGSFMHASMSPSRHSGTNGMAKHAGVSWMAFTHPGGISCGGGGGGGAGGGGGGPPGLHAFIMSGVS